MGSSKKHKERDREREHKHKRRHRSRSRSRDRDRSDRKKKDEKKRKRDRTPRSPVKEEHFDHIPSKVTKYDPSAFEGGENLSLSIQETNKVRAQLGLKPLDTGSGTKDDGKSVKTEDVHVPATNLSDVKKSEDLRRKMAQLKEKRRINMMLGKVKTLGESDSDDDTLAWVRKSRKRQEQKKKAEKQAQILEEMDAEFGIGDLVEEEFQTKKKYTSRDLRGLNIQHGQQTFKEGKTVILTLQDKGVLDEDTEDTLVNVNMIDDEKAEKNVEVKKKKPDYVAYDDKYDEYGELKPREILDKYDEEIHGQKKSSFKLGTGGHYDTEQDRRLDEIKQQIKARAETLSLPAPVLTSEFYTEVEMATFKKLKKKPRKLRKKQKVVTADDLLRLGNESGTHVGSRRSRMKREEGEIMDSDIPREMIEKTGPIPGLDLVEDMDIDKADLLDQSEILGPEVDLTGVPVEEDTAKMELEASLRKARRVKLKQEKKVSKLLAEGIVGAEPDVHMNSATPHGKGGAIVLDATSEFCRSLGEIPTYGTAGNRPEDEDELQDFEQELIERRRAEEEMDEEAQPGWQSVQIDNRPVEIEEEEAAVLDDEPIVSEGLSAALLLANKKGYLDKESKKNVSATMHIDIDDKNYSIEDKRYDDLDEKFRKRDRYTSGIVMDFKEKSNYKPNVNLEYIDEGGRIMNQKEAFRYLSHRFHGKGSGKKKTEKRQKKHEEEQLMKMMSSTDTPLNTVALLMEKQKTEKSPYIVLSGSGKTATSLSK